MMITTARLSKRILQQGWSHTICTKLWGWLAPYYKRHLAEQAGDIYAGIISISRGMLLDRTAGDYIIRADQCLARLDAANCKHESMHAGCAIWSDLYREGSLKWIKGR